MALCLLGSLSALADSTPDCPGNGFDNLPENNRQVLHWERTTRNQYRDRAHVVGEIIRVYPFHSNHAHFALQIGRNSSDTVEIIYNQKFGRVPTLRKGDQVEACGDYITATGSSGGYPPSPDGAIVHWVHRSPNERAHVSGFLMINGNLYGNYDRD